MSRIDQLFVDQIWWYTSRASGIISWVLLTASVIAGLAISSRGSRTLPAGWTIDLHRFFSTLSLLFLTIHLVALVPDNFVHFSWAEIFLPYASEWNPGAVALGVVAFWLMIMVEVTSLVRTRIPTAMWRTIHRLSFVVWGMATAHLVYAGTDAGHPAFRAGQIVIGAFVIGLTGRRIRAGSRRRSRSRSLPIEEPVDIDEVDTGEGREFAA